MIVRNDIGPRRLARCARGLAGGRTFLMGFFRADVLRAEGFGVVAFMGILAVFEVWFITLE